MPQAAFRGALLLTARQSALPGSRRPRAPLPSALAPRVLLPSALATRVSLPSAPATRVSLPSALATRVSLPSALATRVSLPSERATRVLTSERTGDSRITPGTAGTPRNIELLSALSAAAAAAIEGRAAIGSTRTSDIRVSGTLHNRSMAFMLDSGATENFLDRSIAQELGLQLHDTTRTACTASGEIIRMAGYANVAFSICTSASTAPRAVACLGSFLVMDLPGYDAILGQPWLRAHDARITFAPPSASCADTTGEQIPLALSRSLRGQMAIPALAAVQAQPGTAMPQLSPALQQACTAKRLAMLDRHRTALLQEGQDLPTQLPPVRAVQHSIRLIPSYDRNPKARPLHMTLAESAALKKQVAQMLASGQIQRSQSHMSSTPMFVPKKDGELRMVIDYRQLNRITVKDNYPMPLPEVLFQRTQGARVFSTIDLKNGFYQIRLASAADRAMTAFATEDGLYEFVVLPMGLCNAPATFMRLMHHVFADEIAEGFVLVYLDDILIFSKTLEEHERHVQRVFDKLRTARLYAKAIKCNLFQAEVNFLGHRLGRDTIGTAADKVAAVAKWPQPTDATTVRQFCGLANYYRSFIPHCSDIMQPLTALTGTGVPWTWGPAHDAAFRALKAALATQPVLRLPNRTQPFVVMTDASDRAIGAVLQQRAHREAPLQPVAFFSRRLAAAERNYAVHEKETLAIIAALAHWRHYLVGPHFTVETDHASIQYLFTQDKLTQRQTRWLEALSDYDFDVQYIRGPTNVVADALSRGGAADASIAALTHYRTASERRHCPDYLDTTRRENRMAATASPLAGALGPTPAPGPTGSVQMPTQRCTADTRQSQHCKARTRRGEYCHVHQRVEDGIGIRASKIPNAGQGLFALREFTRGQCIALYTGDRIIDNGGASSGPYMLQLTNAEILDAARTNTGYGRWANDPRGSTMNANAEFCVDRARRTAYLRATRAIRAGEEILVPYGASYWRHYGVAALAALSTAIATSPGTPAASLAAIVLGDWDIDTDLRLAVAHDASYRELLNKPEPGEGRRQHEGLLWYNGRCVVPDSTQLRTRIMTELHCAPLAGHLGRDKTVYAIKQRFYWSGMDATIQAFVAACHTCQLTKASQQQPSGLLQPLPIPQRPWESVSLDFITKLPRTPRDHDSIAVFVCRLTKAVHYTACKEAMDAETTARLVFESVVRLHGLPASLVSDRGPTFTSHFWKAFWRMVGTKLLMSTSYHPQTDGQTERANRTLEQMLRAVVNFQQTDWDLHLAAAELAYNATVQASTGQSPFAMQHGFEAAMPIDHALAPLKDGQAECPAATELATRLQERWQKATTALKQAQARQSKAHDAHHREVRFAVGDQVLLQTDKIKLVNSGSRTAKLAPLWLGPFTILRAVQSNAYELDLPSTLRFHSVVNVSRLKRYITGSATFPDGPQPLTRPPPIATGDNGEPEYCVAQIVGHRHTGRGQRRRLQYLVRWQGYSDCEMTWEAAGQLTNAQQAIQEYHDGTSRIDFDSGSDRE